MNYNDVTHFFSDFGYPTLIISALIGLISFILDKTLPEKTPAAIKTAIPFLLGIVLYSLYDLIFISKTISFSSEVISGGLISSSLGTIAFSMIRNLARGEKVSAIRLFDAVKAVIEGRIKDELLSFALSEIVALLTSAEISKSPLSSPQNREKIEKILLDNKKDEIKAEDCPKIADEIILAAEKSKNEI